MGYEWLEFKRQVIHIQRLVAVNDDHALDNISKLSHVTGPLVSPKLHANGYGHSFDRFVVPLGEMLDKMLN